MFGSQSQLWQSDEKAHLYSELCNAFYAREIARLSQQEQVCSLQKRLASLPYYIERAAMHIIDGNSPLQLDSRNGSWVAKQAKTCPKVNPQQILVSYQKTAFVGLIVPVQVYQGDIITVRIDCIDEVCEQQFHCNQFGWFAYSGQSMEQQNLRLLKPSKTVFTAACCGHRWLQHTTRSPRVLSLREMLLAARINWQNFKSPFMAKR